MQCSGNERQIDQAEQELWILTSSDQPDSLAIESKMRAIEKLKSEQRIAFIRSVGEAARMLSKDQRDILLGTAVPPATPLPMPEGLENAGSPSTEAGPTDSPMAMPGATNDSMGDMNSGDAATPKSDEAMGDM